MMRSTLLCLAFVLLLLFTPTAGAQTCPRPPASPANDCNQNSVADQCDLGSPAFFIQYCGKTFVGSSLFTNDRNGNGVPDECDADCDANGLPDFCDADADKDHISDKCETLATCGGGCFSGSPFFDEDHDEIPNCIEKDDLTDPCDSGSFVPRLQPSACGLPNGFFNQINIATVINHLDTPLNMHVDYRDLSGALQGTVSFALAPKAKRDLIVNDMGLKPDTYGTLCVFTDATVLGAWSGGLAVYKRRNTASNGFSGAEEFDYALYYPFTNPATGRRNLPVNTNSIGTDGLGTVANWIRISDAVAGDSKGVSGALNYYGIDGSLAGADAVAIPDGGRFDFGGHAALGANQVGLAQFVPSDNRSEYYIETTRYFYEGVGAAADRFYTAFPIPVRALTGAAVTGNAAARSNEISIIEIVNGRETPTAASVNVFNNGGASMQSTAIQLPPKASFHKILTSDFQAQAASLGSADVSGPQESLMTTALIYGFGPDGRLLYAYAPPFVESAGTSQFTEFNSFIGHKNVLETINSTGTPITASVSIISFDQKQLAAFDLTLAPHAMDQRPLTLPADTYGTIVFTAPTVGLVVRNDVMRDGGYVMPFLGR